MASAAELDFKRHLEELRGTWQSRALAATRRRPMGAVVLSVLAHNYDEGTALHDLLCATFPGFESIQAPFICTAAKIDKRGRIVADMVMPNMPVIAKDCVIFRNTRHLEREFRALADRLKFNDADRVDMINAAKRWVVADRRLDPTMDPRDPDARHLVLH